MKSALLLAGLGLSLAITPAAVNAADIIGPLTFETTGQSPNYTDGGSTGITSQVLDSATTPSDPFGPSGNHSYMIEDNNSSNQTGYIGWWNTAGQTLTKGTFTAQIVTQPVNSSAPYFEIRLGTSNNSEMGNPNSGIILLGSSAGLTFNKTAIGNAWTDNSVHTLVLNFDIAANTVSGTLDKNPIKAGSQEVFPLINNYASSPASFTSINSIEFVAGWSSGVSRVIVDNISLSAVPEPASLSLLGLGGLMLLRKRRK